MNRIACLVIIGLINLLLISVFNLYVYAFTAALINSFLLNIMNQSVLDTMATYQDENGNVVIVHFRDSESKHRFLQEQGLE